MLKSQRMIKVGIVTPNHLLDSVISKLYELKVIQIQDYEKKEEFDIGKPLEKNEALSESIIKIRSIASNALINLKNDEIELNEIEIDEINDFLETTYEELKIKYEKIDYYKKAISAFKKKDYIKTAQSIKIDSQKTKDKDSILFLGFSKKDLEKDVKEISETSNIYTKDVDGVKLTLILAPNVKQKNISTLLSQNMFLSLDKNEIKKVFTNISTSVETAGIIIDKASKELSAEEKALNDRLKEIKNDDEELILNANHTLEKEIEKCEAPLKFAASKNNHIISGYVSEKRYDEIKEELEELTDGKVYIHQIPIKGHEEAPILLNNPKPTRPFHALLDMFTIPNYHEIDPTVLMFITFPIFFGFMLGDMGYGLLTLIIFGLMRLKFKKGVMKDLLNILIISSAVTILFGAIFGEVFGEEVLFGHEIPHLLSRAHQITDLLSVTILIGVVHIALGLILGFINVSKHHGIKHAVTEKLGWILLLPIILWVLAFLNVITGFTANIVNLITPPLIVNASLAGIGVILIVIGEGVRGAIELPAILSNVLSYARLMAVGLASVELAIIINEISKELFHKGPLMIAAAILLLIVGHTINLMLGLIGPFLHSLRLHYVEFFGKFYQGGGKRFVAFGDKEKQ